MLSRSDTHSQPLGNAPISVNLYLVHRIVLSSDGGLIRLSRDLAVHPCQGSLRWRGHGRGNPGRESISDHEAYGVGRIPGGLPRGHRGGLRDLHNSGQGLHRGGPFRTGYRGCRGSGRHAGLFGCAAVSPGWELRLVQAVDPHGSARVVLKRWGCPLLLAGTRTSRNNGKLLSPLCSQFRSRIVAGRKKKSLPGEAPVGEI